MRASIRALQRVPLIKFVGGPHVIPKNINHAPKPHPQAPDGLLPSGSDAGESAYVNTSSIEPEEGVFFSKSQLSKRFKYTPPKESEIDQVISGGAELVY